MLPDVCAATHSFVCSDSFIPLTEGIRLKIFGSPDYPVFLDSLLSDGDSVYSTENLFENLGLPRKRV